MSFQQRRRRRQDPPRKPGSDCHSLRSHRLQQHFKNGQHGSWLWSLPIRKARAIRQKCLGLFGITLETAPITTVTPLTGLEVVAGTAATGGGLTNDLARKRPQHKGQKQRKHLKLAGYHRHQPGFIQQSFLSFLIVLQQLRNRRFRPIPLSMFIVPSPAYHFAMDFSIHDRLVT